MVYYFTSTEVDPPALIYVGKDKFENEELIKHAWDCDVWFHVDKLSSAHVYLRLEQGQTWDNIPQVLLDDLAQLTKANSIEGNKKDNLTIIYTPSSNLKKTADMETGQVAFHKNKMVKKVHVETRQNAIVNRLNKTKKEEYPDLLELKVQYEKEQRKAKRLEEEEMKKQQEEYIKQKRKEKENKNYSTFLKEEYMYSNKGLDMTKSAQELEEDFM
ncbi:Coiled-coil domain-containing protein 25 [Boothiomyces sp. JEL0866]|nr:Coiled-coil domain-containing protein 25 [Boothiomyces sp. JEL0866]